MANPAPDISQSTRAERLDYVKQRFRCIANCETCGNCAILRGRDAEEAYADYIEGRKSFAEASMALRGAKF
ncbi:MAG: hypothetical protein ACI4BH_11950 [Muribaculaceae bacterium]